MMLQSTRSLTCLALVVGSFAIASVAQADSPTTVFNTTSINIFPAYHNLLIENQDNRNINDNRDANGGYSSNIIYYLYVPRKQPTEVVIERQGDRILLVDRTQVQGRKLNKRGQVVAAYQGVGLPSRVFPGLMGLRQIPAEQVPAASVDQAESETAGAPPVDGTVSPISASVTSPTTR